MHNTIPLQPITSEVSDNIKWLSFSAYSAHSHTIEPQLYFTTDLLPQEDLDQYVEHKHDDVAQDLPQLSCHENKDVALVVWIHLTTGDIAPR